MLASSSSGRSLEYLSIGKKKILPIEVMVQDEIYK